MELLPGKRICVQVRQGNIVLTKDLPNPPVGLRAPDLRWVVGGFLRRDGVHLPLARLLLRFGLFAPNPTAPTPLRATA